VSFLHQKEENKYLDEIGMNLLMGRERCGLQPFILPKRGDKRQTDNFPLNHTACLDSGKSKDGQTGHVLVRTDG
jgi:hypothetical protein